MELQAGQQDTHDWVCIEMGNWYSEYICNRCRDNFVEEPEDIEHPPKYGCSPKNQGE